MTDDDQTPESKYPIRAIRARLRAEAARFPILGEALRVQLERIEPSVDRWLTYYPCGVRLTDGTLVDCVYVVDAVDYIESWGVFPKDDRGKREVAIETVTDIYPSPRRLPANLANQLYEAGESGMGYVIFTIVFEDGTHLPCHTGNAVDFIDLPSSFRDKRIQDVVPHAGRGRPGEHGPSAAGAKYSWCLHGRRSD